MMPNEWFSFIVYLQWNDRKISKLNDRELLKITNFQSRDRENDLLLSAYGSFACSKDRTLYVKPNNDPL